MTDARVNREAKLCTACGRIVPLNEAGNIARHMRPERELAWRVCTPSVLITLEAEATQ